MNIRHLALVAVAAALPALAVAQDAHSAKPINVRAGPARDYPLVASYGPGTPLAVQGCTAGYGWCDVVAPGDVRGWVFAGNIIYPFQDQERPLQMYGSVVGIPIVTFSLGSYWGSYYPSRPFFRDRSRWENHAPPGRPVMRPPAPRPPIARPPGVRPPVDQRPPATRPPGDNRPPPVMRPPAPRPPEARPPQARPGEGRPPEGRPPGGSGDRGDRGGDRRGEAPRQPER